MPPAQYVNALYHILLGRAPDQAGFDANVLSLCESGDPTKTLRDLLGSPECRRRLGLVFGNSRWIEEINRSDNSSDSQLMEVIHQLRTEEMQRTEGTDGTLVSIGCMGIPYFDWIHTNLGDPSTHIGLEYYAPKPDGLPANVVWIPNTAGNMIDVADGSADLIFAGQVVEHLWADELISFFHECCRILKPGARLIFDTPNERITGEAGWKHPEHTVEFRPDDARVLLQSLGFTILKLTGHWLVDTPEGMLRLDRVSDEGAYPREYRMREGINNPSASFSWWVEARYDGSVVPDRQTTRLIVEGMWKRYGHSNFNRTISTDAEFVEQRFSGKDGRFVKVPEGWSGQLVRSTHNALPPGRVRVGVELDPYLFGKSPGILEVTHPETGRIFGRRKLPSAFDGGIFYVEGEVPETVFGASFNLVVEAEGEMSARLAVLVSASVYAGEMWDLSGERFPAPC